MRLPYANREGFAQYIAVSFQSKKLGRGVAGRSRKIFMRIVCRKDKLHHFLPSTEDKASLFLFYLISMEICQFFAIELTDDRVFDKGKVR